MKGKIIQQTLIDDTSRNKSLISLLKYEWSLATHNFGKILLLTGPSSSGKTTLLSKFLKIIPSLFTINRKVQAYKVNEQIDEMFFSKILKEATLILGQQVDGRHFYQLNVFETPDHHKTLVLQKLREEFLAITESDLFLKTYSGLLYTAYFDEMKKYLFRGENIILDDSSLYSAKSFEQFKFCSGSYPHIHRVLLYTSIEDTFEHCIARNNKFASMLCSYPLSKNIDEIIKEYETSSGGSSNCYRLPKSIIQDYINNYSLSPYVKKGEIHLAQRTAKELEALFHKISIEQLRMLGLLAYRGVNITKDYVDVRKEIDSIFLDNGKVYFRRKKNFEYIIESTKVYQLQVSELLDYLSEITKWLNVSLIPSTCYFTNSDFVPKAYLSVKQKMMSPWGIKKNLYCKFNDESNIAIFGEFENTYELDKIINVIIHDVLLEKKIKIPFPFQDGTFAYFAITFDKEKKLQLIYQHNNLINLENCPLALSLITLFLFISREKGYELSITDTSREESSFIIKSDINKDLLSLDKNALLLSLSGGLSVNLRFFRNCLR